MRRLLAVALAALPALAHAQTSAPSGVLQTPDGTNLIGTAQCNGSGSLEVRWTMKAAGTGTAVSGFGTVRIYASNKQRSSSTDSRTCWLPTDQLTDSTIKSVQVAQFDGIPMASSDQIIPASGIAAMATAFGIDCTTQASSTAVYLCALPFANSTSTTQLNGIANGTPVFTLDTTQPNPPTGVGVRPADGALVVSFTESTTGTNAVFFRADAVTADPRDPTPNVAHGSGQVNASPARIGGLVNGVTYSVTVVAISASKNESAPSSPPVPGTPTPTDSFWDTYQGDGGVEQGGCAAGAAGGLALLGTAALLRLGRRRS